MEIKLCTLTPLWTGGVDGTCERVHETGIIGSLRWWYEVIVRGLGGEACDPSKRECSFDRDKYKRAKEQGKREREALKAAGLCDVCQVFGVTGWARRFRLELQGGICTYDQQDRFDLINIRPAERQRGWYYGAGLMGTEEDPLHLSMRGDKDALQRVGTALRLIETWGGLGARTQHGYGVVKVLTWEGPSPLMVNEFGWRPREQKEGGSKPGLRDFFFVKVHFAHSDPDWWQRIDGMDRLRPQERERIQQLARMMMVPVVPVIKSELRFGGRLAWPGALKDHIFGTVRYDPRRTAKIRFSFAYPVQGGWEVRAWGYVPRDNKVRAYTHQMGRSPLEEIQAVLADETFWAKVLAEPGRLRLELTVPGENVPGFLNRTIAAR